MTEKLSDRIASELIRHQVRIIRNVTRVVDRIETEVLGQLEATIVGTLIAAAPDEPTRRGDQLNRADAATAEVSLKAKAAMRRADDIVKREGGDIVKADQLAQARIYARRDIAVRPAPDGVIRRIINATIMQGAEAGEWWARQAESIRRSFSDTLKAGLREGEALSELVRRVKGSRAGGVINQGRKRDAEALVRTSIQSQLSGVRDEMFRRNADVIQAQQFMTAFDSKVCPQCAAFSGGVYTLDGKPTKDSPVKVALPFGGPPIHVRCRCIMIAVLDDEEPADDISFEDWLRDQPAAVQVEVLGRTRRDLWAEGKLRLSQLVDQRGRPMTVDQLMEAA